MQGRGIVGVVCRGGTKCIMRLPVSFSFWQVAAQDRACYSVAWTIEEAEWGDKWAVEKACPPLPAASSGREDSQRRISQTNESPSHSCACRVVMRYLSDNGGFQPLAGLAHAGSVDRPH